MSEARLLSLVSRYPHPTALLRHARGVSVFTGLGRLEHKGLVWRRGGQYRLTRSGRNELALTRRLDRLAARALGFPERRDVR
jgi:hypothetical protein